MIQLESVGKSAKEAYMKAFVDLKVKNNSNILNYK